MGLGVSSRHRRSRVSSPAHSKAVSSPSSAISTPGLQHRRCLLCRFRTSAVGGAGVVRGTQEGWAPALPLPRCSEPRRPGSPH